MKQLFSKRFILTALLAVTAVFFVQLTAFADGISNAPDPIAFIIAAAITAVEIVSILTPVVVYLATEFVKKVIPNLEGWVIVSLVVPILSLAVTYLTQLVNTPDLSFWAQLAYGLLAVFINEIFKQIKQVKEI